MKCLPLLPLALLMSAGAASAQTANYSDFSTIDPLVLKLNGDAAQAGSVLRLVPAADTKAGSAFLTTPLALDGSTSFSTSFSFLVNTEPTDPTDGFAFLLQNNGANALGAGGQGLGYVGLPDSMAVVFRGRAPVAIRAVIAGEDLTALTGIQPAESYSTAEGAFYNQTEFAWIDYTPVGNQLNVYLSTTNVKPGAAVLTTTVNVLLAVGTQAYVGFSAGNGGAFGTQDILSWQFSATAVPEPGAAAMLAMGLAVLGLTRRRRQG